MLLALLVLWQVVLQEASDVSACVLEEVAVVATLGLVVAQEGVVTVVVMVKIEVRVKARLAEGLGRVGPLAH